MFISWLLQICDTVDVFTVYRFELGIFKVFLPPPPPYNNSKVEILYLHRESHVAEAAIKM